MFIRKYNYYCRQHFKEHVISKINSNHIDPINILDDQALKMELRNSGNEAAVEDGISRAELVQVCTCYISFFSYLVYFRTTQHYTFPSRYLDYLEGKFFISRCIILDY